MENTVCTYFASELWWSPKKMSYLFLLCANQTNKANCVWISFSSASTHGCLPGRGHRTETRSPRSLDPATSRDNTPHHPLQRQNTEKDNSMSWYVTLQRRKVMREMLTSNTPVLLRWANLDLPDGVDLHWVVVQHPQYRLQHPDVVPVLFDELL